MRSSLCLMTFLIACGGGEDAKEEGADTGASEGGASEGGAGGEGGDGGAGSACPEEVPEEYKYLWDCEASTCSGGWMVYNLGRGAVDAGGGFGVTEDWFVFKGGGEWCVDTFEITGSLSGQDPSELNCTTCEAVYEVQWTMTSDNNCGIMWGSFFIDDEEDEKGPYSGYLMLDTHDELLDERHPDNEMLVVSAPLDGRYYYPNPDYARGTALPQTEAEGGPEDYAWSGPGLCAQ